MIIPAYNAEKTLPGTLHGLMAQTAMDFEIIVVDDGSTDATPEICEKMAGESPVPIRLFQQRNKRQSAARNLGISKAEGDFLIFLDADDLVEKEYIEKLVRATEIEPEIDISCCSYSLLYPDGSSKPRRLQPGLKGQVLSGREVSLQLLEETIEVWSGSALYRRELIFQKGVFYDEKMTMGQDIDFRWRAFYHARKVALVPDILVYYVQHDLSVTRAFDPVRFPHPTWIDPAGFLGYIEAENNEDQGLRSVVQGKVIPRFLTRRLRNYILYGLDGLYWETIEQESTRSILRQGFRKMFFRSLGISLKCLFFLYRPEWMYRRYQLRRKNLRR